MAQAQNFSCGLGDRGACLGYGDTVCSSQGKCVGSNAQCFDSYQCDYEGFTCKSKVSDCVNEYNSLLSNNNDLVGKYNTLLSDYDDLLSKAKKLAKSHDALKDCLLYANDMDDVERCLLY